MSINSPLGLRILQAVIEKRSPTEIAALHRFKAKRAEIEKSAAVQIPDYLRKYLQEVLVDIVLLNQRILAGDADVLAKIVTCNLDDEFF